MSCEMANPKYVQIKLHDYKLLCEGTKDQEKVEVELKSKYKEIQDTEKRQSEELKAKHKEAKVLRKKRADIIKVQKILLEKAKV